MKPEIAEIWTNALESDEYKQATKMLGGIHGYCCLGVLCVEAAKRGVVTETVGSLYGEISFNGCQAHLPPEVAAWAGMRTEVGQLKEGVSLISHNDVYGATFKEIAETIRQNVDVL